MIDEYLAVRVLAGELQRFGDASARGFDATFSAPKSVSVLWALSPDPWVRADVLAAHDARSSSASTPPRRSANRRGGIARRSSFQQVWIKAADAAGWPMNAPLRHTAGYCQHDKGWRWTGSARWTVHDLRHVPACWMLFDLGLDPAIVADKLGHADPDFTIKRYVGIRGNPDEQATLLTDTW